MYGEKWELVINAGEERRCIGIQNRAVTTRLGELYGRKMKEDADEGL